MVIVVAEFVGSFWNGHWAELGMGSDPLGFGSELLSVHALASYVICRVHKQNRG